MSKKRRLTKKAMQEDIEAYAALKAIVGYKPSDEAFSLANVNASHDTMEGLQTTEVQMKAAADGASDDAANGEHNFHDKILGAKTQVKAQFGENSNEYQSLGMKKKEEYKKPSGRRPSGGTI